MQIIVFSGLCWDPQSWRGLLPRFVVLGGPVQGRQVYLYFFIRTLSHLTMTGTTGFIHSCKWVISTRGPPSRLADFNFHMSYSLNSLKGVI